MGPCSWHDDGVAEEIHSLFGPAHRRVQFIQLFTIVWMALEAAASLLAAWFARSPALLAFGGDSLIELLSACVVLWRFTVPAASEQAEQRAARITGTLLLLLAAYVRGVDCRSCASWLSRTSTKPVRNRCARGCGCHHAVACLGKTETFRLDWKRGAPSGRCGIESLRLYGFNRVGGPAGEFRLEDRARGFRCGFGHHPIHFA